MNPIIDNDILARCIFGESHATIALQTMSSASPWLSSVISLSQQLHYINREAIDGQNSGLCQHIMQLEST
jgi:hypothetical protein